MKDSIAENCTTTSTEQPILAKPTTIVYDNSNVPTARPNIPYQNTNHNKKSINGLADFLNDKPTSSSKKSVKPKIENKPSSSKQQSFKSIDQPSCKKHKSSVPSHTDSRKKANSNKPTYLTVANTNKPKKKFGEKFLGPPTGTPSSTTPPNSRDYKMRSRSHSGPGERTMWNALLRQNSGQLKYVDLEWPMWCPRELRLVITPTRAGKPARCKLEESGSKRRRVSSASSAGQDEREEDYTVGGKLLYISITHVKYKAINVMYSEYIT